MVRQLRADWRKWFEVMVVMVRQDEERKKKNRLLHPAEGRNVSNSQ